MGGTRDDAAFYQAETQTLQRENQMLKMRIRELGEHALSLVLFRITDLCIERQIGEGATQPSHAHGSA